MKKHIIFILLFIITFAVNAQYPTHFEQTYGKETPTYDQIINFYDTLASFSKNVQIYEKGMTDSGKPLHLIIYDHDADFEPDQWKLANKKIIFINNGIHPGEPAGIDASMILLRDVVLGKIKISPDIVLAIIPVYNIGGHLNRNATSRVNQNGPESYGFRGNAKNYDLNRDFIKSDTKNSRSFQEIFHWLNPLVFIDTHTSNGADYQHIMTLIPTQHDRLGGELGGYLKNSMIPYLFEEMEKSGYPMVPYVNSWNGTPENGWPQFKDSPRYSSGYAALFHTLSFMPEAHMLKTYEERVNSMTALLETFIKIVEKDGAHILEMKLRDENQTSLQNTFGFNHISDKTSYTEIPFHGYTSATKPSKISGQDRLYYDQTKPFINKVKYYDTYQASFSLHKPAAYVVPQGWFEVVENLQRNGVKAETFDRDTSIQVSVYLIEGLETASNPYEGHYIHSNVKVKRIDEIVPISKGDFLIPMNQVTNRFVMEVLEPEAEDSYFMWNYFDTILQAKEGYSAYVFEDLAAAFLDQNPNIKAALEKKKSEDDEFASNGPAQLRWVYEHSPWKETAHNRYPIYRIEP
ncbi:M14 family zinc carboxypeptidase [Anditalea andensis]|uniref:Peptidase M14 domain-containing protein n=1 Tax=Anditalea andensis TaxID=1048983 RepID=A0A074KW53_9BACT|nr:M14 family zinc carboxypeptidase [Anditalea andensis]KEO73139.1 hypothetical protein EL17_12325 [Anditalea andensis]